MESTTTLPVPPHPHFKDAARLFRPAPGMRAIFVDTILRGEWVTICNVRLNADRGVEHVSGWERNGSTWDLSACCAEVLAFDLEDPATRGAMMDQVGERVGQINTCRVDSAGWGIYITIIYAGSGMIIESGYHKTYGIALVELMRFLTTNPGTPPSPSS